jgi:hypothetical protein
LFTDGRTSERPDFHEFHAQLLSVIEMIIFQTGFDGRRRRKRGMKGDLWANGRDFPFEQMLCETGALKSVAFS